MDRGQRDATNLLQPLVAFPQLLLQVGGGSPQLLPQLPQPPVLQHPRELCPAPRQEPPAQTDRQMLTRPPPLGHPAGNRPVPPPAPVPTHLLWLKSSSRCSSRWLRDSRTGFGNFLGWMRPPWPSVAMVREGTSPPSPSAGVAGVSGGWGHHGVGSPSPLGSLSPRGPRRPGTHPAPRCSSGRCCHPGKGKEPGHTGTLSRSLAPCPAWAGDTAGDTFSRRQSRGSVGLDLCPPAAVTHRHPVCPSPVRVGAREGELSGFSPR